MLEFCEGNIVSRRNGDPRWEKMLTSAGLSNQQLATIEFEFKLPE